MNHREGARVAQARGDTEYGPVGTARTRMVVNVSAGAGSYAPRDRHMLPVQQPPAAHA